MVYIWKRLILVLVITIIIRIIFIFLEKFKMSYRTCSEYLIHENQNKNNKAKQCFA